MIISFMETNQRHLEQTEQMLNSLRFQIHRSGYKYLCIGIPHYYLDSSQVLTKELYPLISSAVGSVTPEAVEQSIRETIHHAWDRRNPEVWETYFPGAAKAPSNKQFIATLAARLK